MFEICEALLVQEVKLLPAIFGIYLLFTFIKDLLFKE